MAVQAMTHNEYWQKRFEELKDSQMKRAELSKREIKKLFRQALKESEKEILAWYQRYAEENNLTLPQAKKELNARERKDFQLTLERYKELAQKQNLSPEYIKMLNNASMRVRLDRSQSLYLKLFYEIEKLANEYELNLKDLLAKTYEDSYYKTAYITQQVKGFEDVTALSSDRIEKTLSKPWTQDGKEFSTRIWEQKTQLVKSLQTEITQGLLTQRGTAFITERIAKKFNTSYSQASRLVETETAYFQERGMLDCFNGLEVEKLQIIATLDTRTSEICREMDTKIVELKDAIPGVTTPPFHCYCRTTTIPYIEGITNADGTTRTARDSKTGKGVAVKGDLTYEQWEDTYVTNPKFAKMRMNLVAPTDEFIYQLAIEQGKPYTKGKVGEERFYADNGRPIYPPNNGGIGTPEKITLKSGEIIYSRYGKPTGSYVSPKDTSFEERAMPRTANTNDLHYYRVVKDIKDVERSVIAAWFGQKGLGIQLKLPSSVESLEENLKEVFINEPN